MTKEEQQHLDHVQSLGCIACRINGMYSPAEIHHVLDGGRRIGHSHVIPLCFPHHRGGGDGLSAVVSRHPYKKRFEAAYGTEQQLLDRVEELLHV